MTKPRCYRFLFWLLLPSLFCLQDAVAEQVGNLYEGKVPVIGQSSKARAAGIQQAFAQVLVKVSGDRGVLSNAQVNGLLKRASSYVQQYRYYSLENSSADVAAPTADRLLWVRFDERGVSRLLQENGLPVWGATRPSVLVWLGEESGANRSLVSLEQQTALKAALNRVADERGLPTMLPLMDLEDRNTLPVSDLWGGFETDIRRASQRYLPDVILVGRLSRLGSEWRGEWDLYLPDKINRWQARAGSKIALAEEGLQQAADALSLRFSPQQQTQGGQTLRIRIHGLTDLTDYVLVRDYLQSLAMIEQLDLLASSPGQLNFLARVRGGRELLERGIQLGAVLEPVMAQPPVAGEKAPPEGLEGESLDYRLR